MMNRLIPIFSILAAVWWFWPEESTDWPIKNAHNSIRNVIAFGDSLTFGKGADDGMSYPDQFAQMTGVTVTNHGKNGDTTASALTRINAIDVSEADTVFITLVGNDIMRQRGNKQAAQNLAQIFEHFTSLGLMVVYLNIDPPLVGSKWREGILAVAKSHGVLWVDRVMQGLWLDSSQMDDKIHPNNTGYRVMAERVVSALKNKNFLSL